MTDARDDDGQPFDRQAFAARLASRMSKERVTTEEILDILAELALDEQPHVLAGPAPTLRIRRLKFMGTRSMDGEPPRPIDYEQSFDDGVNVLLVERNNAGKSSVLKTILFALTGNRDGYDVDVREWIQRIWLTFSIGSAEFTIVLHAGTHIRGALVPGRTDDALERVTATRNFVFRADNQVDLTESLSQFFLGRLELVELGWMAGNGPGATENRTTWRTYLQALHLKADATEYLLCDKEHGIGNQEGLIFSAYLGLQFAKAMNQLRVEISKNERQKTLSESEAKAARAKIATDEAALLRAREELAELDKGIAVRQQQAFSPTYASDLKAAHGHLRHCAEDTKAMDGQIDDATKALQRLRTRILRTDEAIAMRMHLSAIDVTLCPSCEHEVTDEAIEQEKLTHHCRLCGTPAREAEDDHVAQLQGRKVALEQETQTRVLELEGLVARRTALERQATTHEKRANELQAAAAEAVKKAMPTTAENEQREALFERIGGLRASLKSLKAQLLAGDEQQTASKRRERLVSKVRDALREEAELRNAIKLRRLGELTERFSRLIGTNSISGVKVSALGVVQLLKHGQRVSFTGIKNPGEKLRIKLAFFLALAELGRDAGGARHPGLLLIDQPGTSEVVPDDFVKLAELLKHLDEELAASLQLICFSARPELRQATAPSKLYGAADDGFVF